MRALAPAGVWRFVRPLVLAMLALAALAVPALAQITFSPSTLPAPRAGVAYSQTVTASGGTAPYAYTILSGTLPTGLTLDLATGTISGTPRQVGTFNFTVRAFDDNSGSGNQSYSVTVVAPALSLSPGSGALPGGTVGSPYSQTFSASGGTEPLNYSLAVSSGNLGGMGFDTTTGTLSGVSSSVGTVSFDIIAADSTTGTGAPFQVTNSYSITFAPAAAPSVTSVLVPGNGTYGVGTSLDRLTFRVLFDQPVVVTGTPSIAVTVGSTTRAANYVSGSGTSVLTFTYVIQSGDLDFDGIAVGAMALNTGSIRNASGVDADTTLNSVGATNGVLVDGIEVVAVDDVVSTQDNVPVTGNVLTNDIGRDLTASLAVPPVHGTVVLNGDGSFTYTPNTNFSGTDTFEVSVANALYTDNSITTITVGLTPPTVTSVLPNSGPVAGGGTVVIGGSNFVNVDVVSFGSIPASFTVNSASTITATVPPAASGGPVDVTLSKGALSATLTNGYTYLTPGALNVVDGGDLSASGPVGGPFTPSSKTWTLTNSGASDISVVVNGPGGVFDLAGATDGVPFTLVAGGSANVTVNLNASANGLAAGTVGGSVAFVNQTNGSGNTTRQVSLEVEAAALGSVTIRQETSGSDAVFGFHSATAGLNVAISTANGVGQSAAIALPAGSYAVTGDDMSGAGYVLTGLACNDGDSLGDIASRTAKIELAAGEVVICTFTSVNSAEATTALIEDFLGSRAELILVNAPDEQRRIDRLNGNVSGGGFSGSALLGYLSGAADGAPLGVSTSLAAIDAMAGNQQQGTFDAWFEGTFSLFDSGGPRDRFNSAALGADYLLNPDLLVGGFVQFDHLSRRFADDPASISGTGWLAGPYVTARLSDNLYLDLLAAGGQSDNQISPDGSYEDRFDATRYLLSASLQGQWTHENWTFSPRARLSYFEETSDSYVDSLGAGIPAVTVGLGQLAVGPGIGYRLTLESGVVVNLGLRAEGVFDIANDGGLALGDVQARLSGTVGLRLVGGANLGVSARLDGIGAGEGTKGSLGLTLSLPAR
ncbi:hypothetical protein GCM10007913_05710 [Devosia yakushimensis]|uniref:Autotransporter domain-containing protein n=1 Tax=Devosia yakushimensis TaxID=470028 RepID=A0ABQ5U9T8_9HYPH|nr:putative Ig domain-containing protein [Devosia yakushimensis]GLQ08639.1 hypothetical protein GCM10007913_05710 [Devosia yakushimensis]